MPDTATHPASGIRLPQHADSLATRRATLGWRCIYVLPTINSLALLAAVVTLLLMAINFQSALIYALAFWLLALLIVAVFFTWRNLAGLTLSALQGHPCLAGEKAVFEFEIHSAAQQGKPAIVLGWQGGDYTEINLPASDSQRIRLSIDSQQRGRLYPPRLHIQTRFPTGLVRAWAHVSLDMHSIVYPRPRLQNPGEQGHALAGLDEQGSEVAYGTSDFGGIRDYQPGDSPRHIHWKSYAKSGTLHTKTFVDYATDECWLDWHTLPIPGVEDKLSHLCARILQCHHKQQEYGLRLPGSEIAPGSGEAHKHRCLQALALFGQEQP